MPDFCVDDIEISPSDFLEACSSYEIDQLVSILIEDGYINHESFIEGDDKTADEQIFAESLVKLSENKHRLTKEEEEIIKSISNRL